MSMYFHVEKDEKGDFDKSGKKITYTGRKGPRAKTKTVLKTEQNPTILQHAKSKILNFVKIRITPP